MARPTLKTKTERSMYERLHRDVDKFRSGWSIPERNTDFARRTIERWASEGILEEETINSGRPYQVTQYRLAPEWRDDSVEGELLLAALARVDEDEAGQKARLAEVTRRLHETWATLGTLTSGPMPEDTALWDAARDAMDFHHALMNMRSIESNLKRLADQRTRIETKLAARMAIPADAEDGSDPLDGDA